jgi:hypothetical protein
MGFHLPGRRLKVVVVTIESLAAIGNLPEILNVEGVDVFFIGPNDLSHSMGHPAQPHRPEVKAANIRALQPDKVHYALVHRSCAIAPIGDLAAAPFVSPPTGLLCASGFVRERLHTRT